jgi:hypothetical protein
MRPLLKPRRPSVGGEINRDHSRRENLAVYGPLGWREDRSRWSCLVAAAGTVPSAVSSFRPERGGTALASDGFVALAAILRKRGPSPWRPGRRATNVPSPPACGGSPRARTLLPPEAIWSPHVGWLTSWQCLLSGPTSVVAGGWRVECSSVGPCEDRRHVLAATTESRWDAAAEVHEVLLKCGSINLSEGESHVSGLPWPRPWLIPIRAKMPPWDFPPLSIRSCKRYRRSPEHIDPLENRR